MTDFNATLTRAFAEAHEPADDGFSHRVAATVARREKSALWILVAQGVITAAAVAVGAWGLLSAFGGFGPEFLATLGLEIARVHGAATQASGINLASMAMGMTQLLLAGAGLIGGALVYRSSQQ